MGLECTFVEKNKRLKQQLAVNMETLSNFTLSNRFVDENRGEDFHNFLRAYTDIFTKNIYATKDFT